LKRQHYAISLLQALFVTTLLVLVVALWGMASAATAGELAGPALQPQATATPALGGDQTQPPQPAGTVAPGAVRTGEPEPVSAPDAVATANAAATEAANAPTAPPASTPSGSPVDYPVDDTGGTGSTGNTGNPGGEVQPATQPGQTASASGDVPWLPIGLGALVLLAILAAFLMLSRRRTATAYEATLSTVATVTPDTTTTPAAGTVKPYVPGGAPATEAATEAAIVAPTAAAAGAASLPATIECPNCGTMNDLSENFCHECGQDLRPVRAGLVAATAPATSAGAAAADIVADDTPYLETLDRTDEQLEYVLSRPTVNIGTAPANDIVIDSIFTGWETVSPLHATLQREGDGGFVVTDNNSEEGTFVNDVRTGENLLSDGDALRLGSVRFIFHIPTIE
jgi:FHA domain